MKYLSFIILSFLFAPLKSGAQSTRAFDICTYSAPKGFTLKESSSKLFYEKSEGKNYCQLFLYPAITGTGDVEKDFETNWIFFARNASQGIGDPETKEKESANEWQVIFAGAKGSYKKKPFVITLATLTKGDITFYAAAVFSDKKYLQAAQDFIASIEPDAEKFVRNNSAVSAGATPAVTTVANASNLMTKFNTNFDDGWHATATADYVQVTKAGTEVRLHYIDGALDDARPNTVDAPEYYWSKYVEPYFTISNPQKWAGVQYPVIYFMEGNAIEKKTGKACYVAIKIVYSGGARPIVVIAPNKASYQQQFPHPNDADKMLNYNKFALTTADIIGKWTGSGGGAVEYYNAYSGTYAGMSAVSSTDEFVFSNNGTYSSMSRAANMNNGGAQFGGQDFKGKFAITDWSITATNRYGGKTTTYNVQLIAVRNGYLLFMSDKDNPSLNYTLFKTN